MDWRVILVVVTSWSCCTGLNNGLAMTPPMGWLAWERFRCNIDCELDPDNCICDSLFRKMADLMRSEGYAQAGYVYLVIDDCWMAAERDKQGNLVPDPARFPHGMTDLGRYIHSKGLMFGIYGDYGNLTCAGFPGSLHYMKEDAYRFAEWDADYVKLDGCNSFIKDMDQGYPEFGKHLNSTGRSMVYSCSWPFYQHIKGMTPNYTRVVETCNLWRNFDDIEDSWRSVVSVIAWYGENQDMLIANAGPGHWNDPDMLVIGNFGLSFEQAKAQMALWAVLASPLMMSHDLRSVDPEFKGILLNEALIKVNQDPMGIQGRKVYDNVKKKLQIWMRPITPMFGDQYSFCIAFLSLREDIPKDVRVTLGDLGLNSLGGYNVTDLYEDMSYGIVMPDRDIIVRVNPSGVVVFTAIVQPSRVFFKDL